MAEVFAITEIESSNEVLSDADVTGLQKAAVSALYSEKPFKDNNQAFLDHLLGQAPTLKRLRARAKKVEAKRAARRAVEAPSIKSTNLLFRHRLKRESRTSNMPMALVLACRPDLSVPFGVNARPSCPERATRLWDCGLSPSRIRRSRLKIVVVPTYVC